MLFEAENSQKTAFQIAEEKGLLIVKDRLVIEQALAELFDSNPKAIDEYKSKSEKKRLKITEYFVRLLHNHFGDCAEPELVQAVVSESLKKLVQ